MLLSQGTSFSAEGPYDLDPHAMYRWWVSGRQSPENLGQQTWGTTSHGRLGLLGRDVCLDQPHPNGSFAPPHVCPGSGPCRPHSRGGITAATRRSGVSKQSISRWQERRRGCKKRAAGAPGRLSGCHRALQGLRGTPECRSRAPRTRPQGGRGGGGSGDPFAVGEARWTERAQEVSNSQRALGPGSPAHGRSDAADRGGEAVGEALAGVGAARPAQRQPRTPKDDATPGGQSAAQASRGAKASARSHTAPISSASPRASRPPASRHSRYACPASGSLPYVSAPPLGGLSQADQEGCQADRATPSTGRGRLEWASWRPRALDDPSRSCRGWRRVGGELRSPRDILKTKSCFHAEYRLIGSKRNQCQPDRNPVAAYQIHLVTVRGL
jgi:hypothetical protein